MKRIYLDHNATTFLDPIVADEMARLLRDASANPASQHQPGRHAQQQLEAAREAIGELVGAAPDDKVVFTSGGTEANNWALSGLTTRGGTLITSTIEHPSVLGSAKALQQEGRTIRYLSASAQGVIEVQQLGEWLAEGAQLVSVMLANNETGVLQPVPAIARLCSEYHVAVHTDAVQVAGKMPLHFRQLGVTAMSITAHKFHGPLGIGALVVRQDAAIRPLLHGGVQQWGLRPGTESVVLAVGMWKALERWQSEAHERPARMEGLRDLFERLICEQIPNASVIGQDAHRLSHTSNIAFLGCDRQPLVIALDLRGVACSTGSACASGSSEPSPVLVAMGLAPEIINSSIRFSLGAFTTRAEMEAAARRVIAVVQQFRRKSAHG